MTTKSIIDEPNLILLLKKRDKVAFDLLYDRYSSALYGIIMKVVNSEELSQEILQDVFVKIWNNFESYDSTKGRLFTWLLNIARNTSIDRLRSKDFKAQLKNQSIDKSVYEVNYFFLSFNPKMKIVIATIKHINGYVLTLISCHTEYSLIVSNHTYVATIRSNNDELSFNDFLILKSSQQYLIFDHLKPVAGVDSAHFVYCCENFFFNIKSEFEIA